MNPLIYGLIVCLTLLFLDAVSIAFLSLFTENLYSNFTSTNLNSTQKQQLNLVVILASILLVLIAVKLFSILVSFIIFMYDKKKFDGKYLMHQLPLTGMMFKIVNIFIFTLFVVFIALMISAINTNKMLIQVLDNISFYYYLLISFAATTLSMVASTFFIDSYRNMNNMMELEKLEIMN